MIVTKLEPLAKTRYKVYLDGQFAFVLYRGELSRYQLAEGKNISDELFLEIRNGVVLKRAKLRCLHLLKDVDRTEVQLTTKLQQGGYTDDLITEALEYVKSFGYLNDENYAARYVESQKKRKSKKEVYASLIHKGVSRDIIDEAFSSSYDSEDECEAIKTLLNKKRFDPQKALPDEKRKIFAYLSRKGFRYENILKVLQVSEWNA